MSSRFRDAAMPRGWKTPFLLIVLCHPGPLHAQSTAQILSRALWETPGQDVEAIFTRPFQDGRKAILGTGVLLGLIATDHWTTRQFQKRLEPWGDEIRSRVDIPPLYGDHELFRGLDGYAYTAVAGVYVAGVVGGSARLQEAGILASKAIVESYVVSHLILKSLFGRHRPNQPLEGGDLAPPRTRGTWDFFNWHRPYVGSNAFGTAFPSFHFTMYFAVARVMRLELDNVWIPYALGLLPLLYEIDNHGHWVSDMVAGAALGTLIGSVVSDTYHRGASGERMSFGVAPFHGGWAGVVRVGL